MPGTLAFVNFAYPATGGTQDNTDPDRWGDIVHAREFGTITANGSYVEAEADANRIAIQDAIYYALDNFKQAVQLPSAGTPPNGSGPIWLNGPLYVDLEVNHVAVTGAANAGGLIRLAVTSTAGWTTGDVVSVFLVGGTTEANGYQQTITVIDGTHVDLDGSTFANAYTSGGIVYNAISFGFSVALLGTGGPGNEASQGTVLRFKEDLNAPYVIMGPANGATIQGLTILGRYSTTISRSLIPPLSIGLAWSGGSGGGSRLMVRDVGVYSAYTLINLGWNATQLADRTVFENVIGSTGHFGLNVTSTQAFIIDLYGSSIGNCDYNIYNPQNIPININGGGYASGDTHAAVFAISGTSSLTSTGDGSWTLTTVVTAPDDQMENGVYNTLNIKTTSFGPVPFTFDSFDTGTDTVTLRMLDSWVIHHFSNNNIVTGTDIVAELQAATTLFAVEGYTNFYGSGILAESVHVEGSVPFVLWDTGDPQSQAGEMNGLRLNVNPSGVAADWNAGTPGEARFIGTQTFPLFKLADSPVSIEDFYPAQDALSDPYIIDAKNSGQAIYEFCHVSGDTPFTAPSPVLRWWGNDQDDDNEQYSGNRYRGDGQWDRSPWLPRATGASLARAYLAGADNRVPFRGFRPDPQHFPRLTPNQYAVVSGVLPTVGTYPPIHGGTIYQTNKEGVTSVPKLVTSAHKGFSWGQDLTINWSYKGASCAVYMDDTSLMFAGLWINLNFAAADHLMCVTGVFPTMGFVTVMTPTITTGVDTPGLNPGTKTTTYTGSSVKQQVFSWTSLTPA